MRRFYPRLSLLTALLLTTIVAMAIVIGQLWREVGPLRAQNKLLNEERGTLVIGDAGQLHAIEIPEQLAGEGRQSFRVYVPQGQLYAVYLQVNDVLKQGLPDWPKRLGSPGILGGGQGHLHGRLETGERVVTVRATQRGNREDINLEVNGLDVSANTAKEQWPTTRTVPYTIFRDGSLERTTVATDGSEPLVLLRHRFMAVARQTENVSYVIPYRNPDAPLDGVLLWIERIK